MACSLAGFSGISWVFPGLSAVRAAGGRGAGGTQPAAPVGVSRDQSREEGAGHATCPIYDANQKPQLCGEETKSSLVKTGMGG